MSIHLSKIHMKNNDWKERLNVVIPQILIQSMKTLKRKRLKH